MKHTPREWEYEYNNDGNGHFAEWFDIIAVGDTTDTALAAVPIRSRYNAEGRETSEALARLIAQAPKLLQALRDIVSAVDIDVNTPTKPAIFINDIDNFRASIESALQAIAKTEG